MIKESSMREINSRQAKTSTNSTDSQLQNDLENLKVEMESGDANLRRKAALIAQERRRLGLDELVGGLEAVIINTEPQLQQAAAEELLRYTGLEFQGAFQDSEHRTYVLKVRGSPVFHSADFIIRSRLRCWGTTLAHPWICWPRHSTRFIIEPVVPETADATV